MSTIKIRFKSENAATLVRMLITHPMETGRRKDEASGQVVAAHFIETVTVEHNGKVAGVCRLSTGISRDPYLSLRLKDLRPGDVVKVSWVDNLGQKDSEQAVVQQ